MLLDDRTWTSGDDTGELVEHIHEAMRAGVHIACVHEFPSLVGPPRHECEFSLMFDDKWTPAHLTSGATNLYKEVAIVLKAEEWRKPSLVALASKLATSAGEHMPIEFVVPETYTPPTQVKQVPPTRRMSKVQEYINSPDFSAKDGGGLDALAKSLRERCRRVSLLKGERLRT